MVEYLSLPPELALWPAGGCPHRAKRTCARDALTNSREADRASIVHRQRALAATGRLPYDVDADLGERLSTGAQAPSEPQTRRTSCRTNPDARSRTRSYFWRLLTLGFGPPISQRRGLLGWELALCSSPSGSTWGVSRGSGGDCSHL